MTGQLRQPATFRERYGPWAVVTGAADGLDVLTATPGPVDSGFADRAGMQMNVAIDPQQVAIAALNALARGRMTVSPGLLSKTLGVSLGPLPRPLRTRIMGRVMLQLSTRTVSEGR